MAIEGQYTYPYPRPMVTVDAVVFTVRDGALNVLLVKRGHAPWKGKWALPGGFLEMDEEIECGAARELAEETGVTGVRLKAFGTYGAVRRDPRGRVITVACLGVVNADAHMPQGGDDAADARWMPVAGLRRLACDHDDIIGDAVAYLRLALKAGAPANIPLHDGFNLGTLRRAVTQTNSAQQGRVQGNRSCAGAKKLSSRLRVGTC